MVEDSNDSIYRTKNEPHKQNTVKMAYLSIEKEKIDDPFLSYPIVKSGKRGLCVILNHRDFDKSLELSSRGGTDIDCNFLEKIFRKLNYDVRVYLNSTKAQYRDIFESICKMSHAEYDSFVCFILSHGEEGVLYSYDAPFSLDEIFSYFTGVKCPDLIGKPKCFFVQACQGSNFDKGVGKLVTDSQGERIFYKLPVQADFFIANSTYPGYFAWRTPTNGSWFIQELYQALSRCIVAKNEKVTICQLMTMVARKVAFCYESHTNNSNTDGMKQMITTTSTLTKLFYPITDSI